MADNVILMLQSVKMKSVFIYFIYLFIYLFKDLYKAVPQQKQ